MFSTYLLIFLRVFKKQKFYSFINIAGLAIGIACFIILTLLVLDESGYDTYNEKADRIYRVYISSEINGNASNSSKTACPLGSTLKSEFPEVQNFARLGYFGQYKFRYKDIVFRESDVYTADSTYFGIFTLPFKFGNPKTALIQPNSIVITEKAAEKYFGTENPLGKQFIVDDTTTFNVTGVLKNFPRKSHFSCNFLLSMSTYPATQSQNWINGFYTTYVLFKQKIDPREFEKKLQRLVYEKVGPQASEILGINLKEFLTKGNRYGLFLQPLTSIYLYSQPHYNIELNTEWGDVKKGNIYYSYIFMAIGIFILAIAVFNFMNLVTARSENRAREVGIRKTLGSDRKNLIWQFISESTLTCFLSVLIACGLTIFILPTFNSFLNREITFNLFNNFYTIPLLIAFTLVIGIISGSYPAFYLSSFQPSHILKSKSGRKKNSLRSALVIIQFTISITLIIGTLIIKNQLNYVLNKDLGFKKERLLIVNNASAIKDRAEAFKQILSENPGVVSSTNSSLMFQTGIPGSTFQIEDSPITEFKNFQLLDVDYDFARTYGIKIIDGRYFSKDYSTDSSAVVINETAAKILNAANPVGKVLYWLHTGSKGKVPLRIIGLVKNFNYESLHQGVRPLVFHISRVNQAASMLAIRIRTDDYSSTINSIKKAWTDFTGIRDFYCTVLNENLERMYRNEIKIGQIISAFSLLAILIACLGLFGLAAFITEQRTKEIGIRKTLGASVFGIVVLLSKEFTKWVLLANLISWPVAYFIMNKWLQNFAYRIELGFTVFLVSGAIALLIAITTVSFQTIKAALNNPINSLRYE
jgi:putative ABC transport system permease protein